MDREKHTFEDNLGEDAPLLNSIPKTNSFKVPDCYFDGLPALIMEKCRESNKKPSSVITDKLFWLLRPQWMLATFIVVVAICFIARKNTGTSILNYDTIAAAIPDSVIMQNLQSNIDYVDMSSLEELAQNNASFGSLPQQIQDTSNGQIINYLMNSNLDATDIENEL